MFKVQPVTEPRPENGAQLKCEFCEQCFGHKDEGWKQVEVNKVTFKDILYEQRMVFRCKTCTENNVIVTPYGATLRIKDAKGNYSV